MTSKRNARGNAEFSGRLSKARKEISGALGRAMAATESSQRSAARVMSMTDRTVRDWLHGVTPVAVERVLAAPRLAKAFRRELCGEHHGQLPGYVAKKKASR